MSLATGLLDELLDQRVAAGELRPHLFRRRMEGAAIDLGHCQPIGLQLLELRLLFSVCTSIAQACTS